LIKAAHGLLEAATEPGIGADASFSVGDSLLYQVNVTLGFGLGGRGSAGAATNTTVIPFCKE
jgi:hypothetical protein